MPWCYVIDIHAPVETAFELDCVAGGCDEPLRWWGNHHFECVMRREIRRRRATRHLYVGFAYGRPLTGDSTTVTGDSTLITGDMELT